MTYGTNGTASRYYVGPPADRGQWVRLEVPASALGLEGQSLTGMSFSVYNGRVTWELHWQSSQSAPPPPPPPPPPPADTTAPTVSLSAPANGATVSGASVNVSANASDNVGVAGVQFKLDGANLGAEDTASPYSVTWNSFIVRQRLAHVHRCRA